MTTYCDYIATLISKGLIPMDFERLFAEVDKPQPYLGFAGVRQTIRVLDVNGQEYNITIEEVA